MKKALTLLEHITVIIILGILSALALMYYSGSREKILDKEAVANLKLIRSAELGYYLEKTPNSYYPSSGSESSIPAVNANLKLSLYGESTRYWDYTVYSTGCAQATRRAGGDGRSWYLNIADNGTGSSCTTDGEPNTSSCYACP